MTPTEQRRKEFEEWVERCGLCPPGAQTSAFYFMVWQAAADLYERKTLERAVEICKALDESGIPAYGGYTNIATAIDCADAIEREIKK